MRVVLPEHYKNERVYVINIIFSYLFSNPPEIEIKEIPNYQIILDNNSVIEIEDHFFSEYTNSTYLKHEALPSKVIFFESKFCCEMNLPVLYGIPEILSSDIKTEKTIIKFDLIASVYFMLTRWEEFVNHQRDQHNRFSLYDSVAYKNNFYLRPVVNEYFEFLWNIMRNSDSSLTRVQRQFSFTLTHDIDTIERPLLNPKILGRTLLKNRDLPGFFKTLYFQTLGNPNDSFKYLMDLSEKINTRSVFYIMTGRTDPLDFEEYSGTRLFKKIIAEIKDRGHLIGLHPSYNSYNDSEILLSEKKKLETITSLEIKDVRQHYLRLDLPGTLVNQDRCGFRSDSSLGFVEDVGFRCGICNEFPVFDFLSGRQLELSEKPLIAMEGSLVKYKKSSPENTLIELTRLIDKVKKFEGEFIFLWHNTSFNKENWFAYQYIYLSILDYLNGR